MLADIKSFTRDELAAQFKSWDLPGYRLDQVLKWLYEKRAASWAEMTNLSKGLHGQLALHYSLHPLELVRKQGSRDTTQKFLWKLSDGAMIESVLIPANPALYGEASDRHTLCVSTQVGCAYGCKFCASGLDGWKRNLRVEEIIEQVLATERWNEANAELKPVATADVSAPAPRSALPVPRLINNLVIMGMGEPLANYENLLKALRILNAPWGGGIGARKITISTSGLAPQIRRLAEEPLQFRLAISLHGATDETRNKIMPVNKKYPLAELTSACEEYQRKRERMITLVHPHRRRERRVEGNQTARRAGASVEREGESHPLQQGGGALLVPAQRRRSGGVSRRAGITRRNRDAAPREGPRHRRRLRPASAEDGAGTGGRPS